MVSNLKYPPKTFDYFNKYPEISCLFAPTYFVIIYVLSVTGYLKIFRKKDSGYVQVQPFTIVTQAAPRSIHHGGVVFHRQFVPVDVCVT